jgi:DNA-binding LacI/PurR family transcriptional regulator
MSVSRPTLEVIAAELGVSRTTVSNAFSRPDQLSAALRERVLAAAARLGYAGPDPVARGLARGRVGVVGLLLASPVGFALADPAMRTVLDGLVGALAADQTGLLLLPHTAGAEAVGTVPVDGFVVVSGPEDDAAIAAAVRRGLPVVALDQPRSLGIPVLRIDDRGGARLATRHLRELGHTRIGIATLHFEVETEGGPILDPRHCHGQFALSRDRLLGHLDGLGGLDPVLVWETPRSHREHGRDAAAAILAADPATTAIALASDELALGAIEHLLHIGKRVPEDVSVVGFDDIAEAAANSVPLTTVRQPLRERGEQAARIVLDLIGGTPAPKLPVRRLRLVERASTAPAP